MLGAYLLLLQEDIYKYAVAKMETAGLDNSLMDAVLDSVHLRIKNHAVTSLAEALVLSEQSKKEDVHTGVIDKDGTLVEEKGESADGD